MRFYRESIILKRYGSAALIRNTKRERRFLDRRISSFLPNLKYKEFLYHSQIVVDRPDQAECYFALLKDEMLSLVLMPYLHRNP